MATKKWWVLTAVACGTFMATLDSSIVNIALPTLVRDLDSDLLRVKWIVVAYLLVVTCFLLPFGRISDQFGRKKIFQIGFIVFTVGSFLCGIVPNLKFLIGARILQALGVCMLMANGPAIITSTFPEKERGGALGVLAMVVSSGLLSGPGIGGLLIGQLGWRSIFFLNIPVGLLGVWLVQVFVKDTRPSLTSGSNSMSLPFDWAGTLCQCLFLFSFITLLDPPNISVSGSLPVTLSPWVLALITIILGAIFFKIETDAKAPILDIELLRNRMFWTGNLAGLLLFISYSGVTVLAPFFLEEIMKKNPGEAGLFLTAIPLAIFVVAPISGRLSDRMGGRGLSFFGAALGALSLLAMGGAFGKGLHAEIKSLDMVLGLGLVGVATGLFQSPNNNAIMSSVEHSKLGVASAFLATVRNLGMVTGTGVATTLYSLRLENNPEDLVGAIRSGLLLSGLVGIVAAFVCLAKPKRGRIT